jgi:hypothetical protein
MNAIDVSVAISWLWRCETEGVIIPGSELRLADDQARGVLAALSEKFSTGKVARGKLRHKCGGHVIPIAPASL